MLLIGSHLAFLPTPLPSAACVVKLNVDSRSHSTGRFIQPLSEFQLFFRPVALKLVCDKAVIPDMICGIILLVK
jgi:hypothetical protein